MAYTLAPCGGIKLDKTNFTIDEDGTIKVIGDGTGVTDFSGLTGKPQINGHELVSGNNTLETLGIQAKGNYITQGSKIAATDITEDGTHKFVTDTEKSTWNSKAPNEKAAAGTKDGLMSKEDKAKLDGTEANANNYTHPAKHEATIITETTEKRFVSDAEKSTWNGKANNTVASGSANGLMSSAHFTKLEGIAPNANNYVLPAAKTSAIGGVKQATAVPEASGENVTKAEFKALLDALKTAGIMANA